MNLSLISSSAEREVCGNRDRRRVIGRFRVPGTQPCITTSRSLVLHIEKLQQ